MGQRVRVLIIVLVLTGVGLLLGSLLSKGKMEAPELEPRSAVQEIQGRVRVEVLNGGGVPGVAWEATRTLRHVGFDVVGFGNAGTYSDAPSVVMDRVGELETARLVAEALGIPLFRSEPDSTLFVDVTVRLGPDWTAPIVEMEEVEEASPWWGLRRFFRGSEPPETQNPTGQ